MAVDPKDWEAHRQKIVDQSEEVLRKLRAGQHAQAVTDAEELSKLLEPLKEPLAAVAAANCHHPVIYDFVDED